MPRRLRAANQLAKFIVDLSMGGAKKETLLSKEENLHAVSIGGLGGLKGGKARAKALNLQKRSEVAPLAASKRWEIRTLR